MAQDRSKSADGGAARDYSLIRGWSSSYPETTGYIIPTLLDYARLTGDTSWRDRALRMADWLVSIQLPCGGFQGGKVDALPVVPVTFNTGQILLGLAAAERETGRYREPMRRAADWLVATQDADGCWRKHESPFAAPGDKQYETHVAWGLFEAGQIDRDRGYVECGFRTIDWALRDLPANGWYARCSLTAATNPITHTIGYTLRGVIEACRHSPENRWLDAARRTAIGLASTQRDDGFLPGMLDSNWRGCGEWACLTGTAQVASCWMLLDHALGTNTFTPYAQRANQYLRRTVRLDAPEGMQGGVKGSFPVDGAYGAFEYLNWAAKFTADSLMLER